MGWGYITFVSIGSIFLAYIVLEKGHNMILLNETISPGAPFTNMAEL